MHEFVAFLCEIDDELLCVLAFTAFHSLLERYCLDHTLRLEETNEPLVV